MVSFSMESPMITSPEQTSNGPKPRYRIETKSLSYELPSNSIDDLLPWRCGRSRVAAARALLRNVSCEARPDELLAIVGPSGAGKTTLLSVLAGVIHPSRVSGEVLVNGSRMNVARFRRVSGYVTQDDELFPLLTVEESLIYSARLRLGASSSDSVSRARQLLKELGLDHAAGSRIGGGISGGERRRVSIGVELVHDPAVLLLDEPTSGLDSASALHVVSTLKNMAATGGKTVVLTIHQPGFRILSLFDSVLLMSDGTVKHQGPLSILESQLRDSGHNIPNHVNVLEYAMDAVDTLTIETNCNTRTEVNGSNAAAAKEEGVCYANSRHREIAVLTGRFFKNTLRTKQLFVARMLQSIIAGIGLGTVFMNVHNLQARVGFFAFSLTFLLSSTTEGLPIFLQERRILLRETTRGAYRVSSYVIANALVFLMFLLLAAMLYSSPVYWLIGLQRNLNSFLFFCLVVWMVMLTANSFVLCFSALVPNFIMGNSVIAGLMGSFFLFSGYFISKNSIPNYWIFMHYISLFKYPFEAFLINEYGGVKGRTDCLQIEDGVCVLNGDLFLRHQGVEEFMKWRNVAVMFGFICGYRLICFVILWFRCYKMRR